MDLLRLRPLPPASRGRTRRLPALRQPHRPSPLKRIEANAVPEHDVIPFSALGEFGDPLFVLRPPARSFIRIRDITAPHARHYRHDHRLTRSEAHRSGRPPAQRPAHRNAHSGSATRTPAGDARRGLRSAGHYRRGLRSHRRMEDRSAHSRRYTHLRAYAPRLDRAQRQQAVRKHLALSRPRG